MADFYVPVFDVSALVIYVAGWLGYSLYADRLALERRPVAVVMNDYRLRWMERMLERDVDNMRRYFGRFAPELLNTDYGKEIWALYESGDLHPDSKLTGCFQHDDTSANVDELMEIIDAAQEEEWERQERMRKAEED